MSTLPAFTLPNLTRPTFNMGLCLQCLPSHCLIWLGLPSTWAYVYIACLHKHYLTLLSPPLTWAYLHNARFHRQCLHWAYLHRPPSRTFLYENKTWSIHHSYSYSTLQHSKHTFVPLQGHRPLVIIVHFTTTLSIPFSTLPLHTAYRTCTCRSGQNTTWCLNVAQARLKCSS